MARYPLPGDNVFPEGITDGGGTTFYVGSMGDGTIFRGDAATGAAKPFVPPDGDGRTTITGLAVDGHGRLIACDFDGGQLFVYSLATAALVARTRKARGHPAARALRDRYRRPADLALTAAPGQVRCGPGFPAAGFPPCGAAGRCGNSALPWAGW